ncbi:MAG: phosphoglycerate kinase [Microgenomates group bacterium Gr01-1014_16]|nr:MAG: phosphoglycerate kinase [Microgenomates group bacterium Gr01-1014_16]
MNLLTVKDINFSEKNILVRGDLDVDDKDNLRTESVRQVVKYLLEKGAKKIKVIGHTETKYRVVDDLRVEFPRAEFDDRLRDNPGEKGNSEKFAEQLAEGWDVYVNEAFATSHRDHASIDALPKLMKKQGKEIVIGLRFGIEIEKLGQIWEKPGKRILVIGGVKVEEKQKFADKMGNRFAAVLKGGLLVGVDLRPDGLDISDEAINNYIHEISSAEVILAAGVMGKYENENSSRGTKEVLNAIAGSHAYKVAGGGDIERAIDMFGLTEKFDWISVGGGAMLEYLSTGTLVGIEAIS